MRLTPLDIQQRMFNKSFRGYDENDVNEFIGRISRDYEGVYSENRNLREQVDRLKDQVHDYIELERTLKQTLVSAQKTSQELKSNAERESELILKEAELKAERVLQEAREEAKALMREIQQLRKQKRLFKIELRNMLDAFKEILHEDDRGTLGKGRQMVRKVVDPQAEAEEKPDTIHDA